MLFKCLAFIVNGVTVFYRKYSLNLLEKWIQVLLSIFQANGMYLLSQICGIQSRISFGEKKKTSLVSLLSKIYCDRFWKIFNFYRFQDCELMTTWILFFFFFLNWFLNILLVPFMVICLIQVFMLINQDFRFECIRQHLRN